MKLSRVYLKSSLINLPYKWIINLTDTMNNIKFWCFVIRKLFSLICHIIKFEGININCLFHVYNSYVRRIVETNKPITIWRVPGKCFSKVQYSSNEELRKNWNYFALWAILEEKELKVVKIQGIDIWQSIWLGAFYAWNKVCKIIKPWD